MFLDFPQYLVCDLLCTELDDQLVVIDISLDLPRGDNEILWHLSRLVNMLNSNNPSLLDYQLTYSYN